MDKSVEYVCAYNWQISTCNMPRISQTKKIQNQNVKVIGMQQFLFQLFQDYVIHLKKQNSAEQSETARNRLYKLASCIHRKLFRMLVTVGTINIACKGLTPHLKKYNSLSRIRYDVRLSVHLQARKDHSNGQTLNVE